MKLSTTTITLFASIASLVSAFAQPKASVQASIATAGNRAILALDDASQAMSTFTDEVQAATESLEIDPAVKEEFKAYVSTLSRRIDQSIVSVEGLIKLFGPERMKNHKETSCINQNTPTRKLKESTDRISAIYAEYSNLDDMPEAVQTELNALWQDFAKQMKHIHGSPLLGSDDGLMHISSKSRTGDKSDKSDEALSPLGKLWMRIADRAFIFRGGEMLEKKKEKE